MKTGYTHIAIVLDRSGSMQSCAPDTIGGFNAFIEDQKKVPGEATLTLVQFDDQYEVVHAAIVLSGVPGLVFRPRGSTALLDAIGKTIIDTGKWLEAKAEADRPDKVIFVILTDGHENASKEFKREQIFAMIRHQEAAYRWEFLFIGANQDAIDVGMSMGVQPTASLTYNATRPRNAFASTSNAIRASRVGGKAVRATYTQDDREENKPGKA